VVARADGREFIAVFRERHAFSPGARIRLRPRRDLAHLFDRTTGKRL
jgi:multiple sugar transport system ATP-binding protein